MPRPIHAPAAAQDLIDSAVASLREVAPGGARRALAVRNINFVKTFLENAHDEDIERAAAAETDFGALLVELSLPAVMARAGQDDPLAEAYTRGGAMMERLLHAEGGAWTVAQVARRLGIKAGGVNQRLRRNRLIALDVGRKGFAYPAWQFAARGGTLRGLEKVLAELRKNDCDAWDDYTFFLNGSQALAGRTPLAVLREGGVDAVVHAARQYARHGAS